MKINKIEISAFRIYDDPVDSVFDFSSNSGEVADFVSLYAPNGFGKTSFYDAVEWGITGSVNRFFIRNKELNKLEINQTSKNKIPVLRNSMLIRDTYVKVFSSLSESPFENVISKDSTQPDLPLKKDAVSHNFHKVILSQDWISAFLTEKSGEQRYTKFMENPELSGMNDYYTNLKHLFSHQVNEEKKLENEIEQLNQKVKDIGEQNLLETINNQIDKINRFFGEDVFKLIEIGTTDKELIEIKDDITRKISAIDKEIKLRINIIDKLRLATTGGDGVPSLKSFCDIKSSLPNTLIEFKTIEDLLTKFEKKRKATNELASLQESLKELTINRETAEERLLQYNKFEIIQNQIKLNSDEKTEIKESLVLINEKVDSLKREEVSLNGQLQSTLQQISEFEEKKKGIPILEKDITDTQNAINEVNSNIIAKHSEIEPLQIQLKDKNEEILDYKILIDQLEESKYSKKNLDEKSDLIKLVDELNKIHSDLITQKASLRVLDEKINKQEELNSTIQSFIKQGLVIVNESQSSKCPLCEQPYKDFVTLANKISGNDNLSNVIKGLFSQKQTLTELINQSEETIKNGRQRLLKNYQSQISQIEIEIIKSSKELNLLHDKVAEYNGILKKFKLRNVEFSTLMLGLTIDEYKNQLVDSIVKEQKEKENIIEKLICCQKKLKTVNEAVDEKNNKLVFLKKQKEELIENTDYKYIVKYFDANYPFEEINRGLIEKNINELKDNIVIISNEIKVLNEILTSLKVELVKFNEENLRLKTTELNNKKRIWEDELNNYILFFKENFDVNIETLDINGIAQYVENENKNNNKLLNDAEFIREELFTLNKNSEHISEFLRTERIKGEILTKEEELSFLVSFVKPDIKREREKVKEFLENRIKDFFYEKLINKLYSKIDPHPEFKDVEFRANLDTSDPRLDIFVKSKSMESIIPNLYFSTAQINILSLCIFLASALKSTEYDCIFIDDPIQSMDSINVLSTIDLLRSIIVNNGKQIIISTHDENFHNLLKKKIPVKLFKSKFLKLESFGKVVNDI